MFGLLLYLDAVFDELSVTPTRRWIR